MNEITLYLVRHGTAAARWDEDIDPGLSLTGQQEAAAMAAELAPRGPLPLVASPLRRTRETAAPLAARWSTEPKIEPRVAEIRSPTPDLTARRQWLDQVMADRWSNQSDGLRQWRGDVLRAVQEITEDSVVVSHFVAINVIVGAALNRDDVICFRPDTCSITQVAVIDRQLMLRHMGDERATEVL